jgi:hypothetical protein
MKPTPSPHRGGARLPWITLFAIGVMGAGCYPKGAPAPAVLSANSVASASARWPGVTQSSLSAGRDQFVSKCNGCHAYPDLAAIPDERWPAIVERMAKKSGLGAEDGTAVLRYVLAARSEQAGR